MSEHERESYSDEVDSYRGNIPLWLAVVYIMVIIWGIYYLIKYWDGF